MIAVTRLGAPHWLCRGHGHVVGGSHVLGSLGVHVRGRSMVAGGPLNVVGTTEPV